jgi:hypothetical protein
MNISLYKNINKLCNDILEELNNFEKTLDQKKKDIDTNLENCCQKHFGISYAEFEKLDSDSRFKLLTKNIN